MSDDDLYGSVLTPPPATSPIVRSGAPLAAVVLVMGAAIGGCNPGAPSGGDSAIVDAGISAYDATPGVDGGNPGVIFDAGIYVEDATPGVDAGHTTVDGGPSLEDAGDIDAAPSP